MQRIIRFSMLFILLGLASLGYALNENDACTNPAGEPGRCIYMSDCEPSMTIHQRPILEQDDGRFVDDSRCGIGTYGKPLVCCPVDVINPGSSSSLPKPPNCGESEPNLFVRHSPWTALIEYRKRDGRTGFHCGASLINSRYVVTAAHCIKAIPRGWEVIGVRLGEWDLNSEEDCYEGDCSDESVNMGVEKIIVHENYDPNNKAQYNDIALIRFTRDVHTSPFISPVCLPVDNVYRTRNNVGSTVWSAGWGRTETASASNFKLKVELEVQDPASCANIYRPSGITLRDTQICAGGVRGLDTCSADSGGSLTKRLGSRNFLYGIVSFGPYKCGTKGVPGVFTNVAKYVDWIESKME